MSGATLLGISLLYAVPVALLALLSSVTLRRRRWPITAALAALPLFYIGHYQILGAIQGWPADTPLPAEFRMLGFDVTEPDPRRDQKGEILLWVRAAAGQRPRVHHLSYSKELHETLVEAGRLEATGNPQVGTRQTASGGTTAGSTDDTRDKIVFRPEQRPSLPRKDGDS